MRLRREARKVRGADPLPSRRGDAMLAPLAGSRAIERITHFMAQWRAYARFVGLPFASSNNSTRCARSGLSVSDILFPFGQTNPLSGLTQLSELWCVIHSKPRR